MERLQKFRQFKRQKSQSVIDYFVQLVAKANKGFPEASSETTGKEISNTFALNAGDAKLTAKVIDSRDMHSLDDMGKLVPKKETPSSMDKANKLIDVSVHTKSFEVIQKCGESRSVPVQQEMNNCEIT